MAGFQDKERLLKGYNRMARSILPGMYEKYPSKWIAAAVTDTRQEFLRLIPQIPFIGENHIWQFNLDTAAMNLALYRALRKQGYSTEEIARMASDMFEAYLLSFPRPLRWAYRQYYFSSYSLNRLRRAAQASQLRRYPEDWVFTYVEGNGVYDAGIDIHECAIVKFFHAQGAEEFAPHLCPLDHLMGNLLGLGFSRAGTLAGGAAVCDCRWKRGAVSQNGPAGR